MWNWGQKFPRQVPFVDLQCPLIHRDVLSSIGRCGYDNLTGWGIDAYIAITCKKNGWNMAVLDYVSMLHHNSLTIKKGVAGITMQEYCQRAERDQLNFFTTNNLLQEFHEVRNLGENYEFTSVRA
jgi:hypothetical protein